MGTLNAACVRLASRFRKGCEAGIRYGCKRMFCSCSILPMFVLTNIHYCVPPAGKTAPFTCFNIVLYHLNCLVLESISSLSTSQNSIVLLNFAGRQWLSIQTKLTGTSTPLSVPAARGSMEIRYSHSLTAKQAQ